MFGRDHAVRGGHVRSRVAALTVAAGLAVSGTFALTPSTAGAAGPDPLGPTIAQLQAFYATAVANVEGGVVSTGVITDDLSIALDQVGCLVLTVTNVLGTTHAPPSFDCIL